MDGLCRGVAPHGVQGVDVVGLVGPGQHVAAGVLNAPPDVLCLGGAQKVHDAVQLQQAYQCDRKRKIIVFRVSKTYVLLTLNMNIK